MPLSRKKSCASCRHSKSRCNQATPNCSRCSERGIRCVYDWKSGSGAPYAYSPASRTSRASHISTTMVEEPLDTSPQSGDPSDIFAIPASVLTNPFLQTGEVIPESTELDWTAIDAAAGRPFGTPKLGPSLDMPTPWIGVQRLPEIGAETMSNTTQNIASTSFIGEVIAAPDSGNMPCPPLSASIEPLPPRRAFQKRRVFRHSALSSVALGQLASFPKMMIQGDRLPPFITPTCHLHEELAFDCAKSRRHRCLPKELAICASLVEMFYSRTEQNAQFVWQTIYAEKDRLFQEHENFNLYQQLAALQALTIYILLQAQDVETSEANGAYSLLGAVIDVSKSVTRRNKLDTVTDTDTLYETPSRQQWVQGESARRTIILLIIVDIMMDSLLKPAAYQSCSYSLHTIPLPATRDLWEAQSNFIWITEYERYLSRRKTRKTLNIGDLLELDEIGALRNLSRSDQRIDIVPDILNWCEGLDALGSLLWMVMPFQQVRTQTGISDEG